MGTRNTQNDTEFNLLAKRAEDLRAQRFWGYCRDARFVRPHSAWLSRTQNARNTQRFLTEEQKDIFFWGAHRNHRLTQNFDRST